jgi:hypothetical protein
MEEQASEQRYLLKALGLGKKPEQVCLFGKMTWRQNMSWT